LIESFGGWSSQVHAAGRFDVEVLGRRAEVRHALHGRSAGADDADALAAQTR
jgi:hypothetical protein